MRIPTNRGGVYMGNVFQILFQIGILYLFYYTGSWIQKVFHLLLPGSIIGMLLLFGVLLTKKFKLTWIDKGSSFLLSHLPLLFIPVTVGIIDFFDLFRGRGIFSIVVVFVSTLLVMISTSMISQWIAVKKENLIISSNLSEKRDEL